MAEPPDNAPPHAEAFARAYPALADRLAQPSRDPELERLVEGFSTLAQRVERVIEATSLRAVASFAEVLAHEVLRPFPSASILELTPLASHRPARASVAAGAEFESVPVEGTRCRFRAHAPFTLVPWRVTEAKLAWSASDGQSLEVGVAPIGMALAGEWPLPLCLHFAGEPRHAFQLLAWIHQHLVGVELDVNGRVLPLGRDAVRPWGLRREEALLPVEPLEHPGLRLLRELLILPAKFAFVEVSAPPVVSIEPGARVVLRFRFDATMPVGMKVDRDGVRTNCVPVVNAFETTSDPVRPSLERPEHPVRPAGLRPEHGEVYAVREVVARWRNGERATVAPVTAFGAASPEAHAMRYALETTPSRLAEGSDVSISAAAEDGLDAELDVLSIELWATNRALPTSLGIGDVRVAGPRSPRGYAFRNVRALTPYRAAPHGDLLVWRVLALSALSARTLASRDALRTLLHALDLHAIADVQAGRAHAQKLEAIVDVGSKPSVERLRGASVRGHDVTVRLNDSAFDGEGDAFVFAQVLAHLFAHEASLSSFVRTTVHLTTTGRVFRFPARNAEREIA
jgi:type VI secretion system protein ImpG